MNKYASRRWPSRLVGRKRLLAPKEAFSHMVLPSKTFCPPYQMITLLHLKYFLCPTMQGCRFQSQVAVRTFTTRQKLPPHSACWSWGCIAEQAAPQLLLLVRLLSEGSMSVFPKQPPEKPLGFLNYERAKVPTPSKKEWCRRDCHFPTNVASANVVQGYLREILQLYPVIHSKPDLWMTRQRKLELFSVLNLISLTAHHPTVRRYLWIAGYRSPVGII